MNTQRGSVLLEYLVVLALTLLAAIWALSAWSEKRETLALEAKVLWMQAVQGAVERYIERFSHTLIESESYSAQQLNDVLVHNWQHPTIAELRDLEVLPGSFSDALEDKVRIWVFKSPQGCSEDLCFLHALIAARTPLLNADGAADAKRLSLWRELTQGAGLVVQAPYDQWIAAQHLRWPNTFGQQGALGEGTIALAVQGDELWHRYLRVRDDRDPFFQNQVTVTGPVHSEHSLATEGYLLMQEQAQAAASCPRDGALAYDQFYPAFLTCRQGLWTRMIGYDGGHYIEDRYGYCAHPTLGDTRNPVTGSCSCGEHFVATPISLFTDSQGHTYRSYLCRPRFRMN